MDAAATEQTARTAAEQPQEPHPVIPIVLTAGKPAEKLKEITDRLEQGITELFDSERYKEYLKVSLVDDVLRHGRIAKFPVSYGSATARLTATRNE